MTGPASPSRLEAASYLAWAAEQPEKHEYLDDEVFAIAGASDTHVHPGLKCGNCTAQHLRGGPCCVSISDIKLRVEADNQFLSAVVVICA